MQTELKLQAVPLIFGTNKFKMLVPFDYKTPVSIFPATTEIKTPEDGL